MQTVWVAIVVAVLGSGALSAFVTHWLQRRKTKAEAAELTVQTALALEERAMERYHSAIDALEVAQRALDAARNEVKQQELYISELHSLLERAGVKYPKPRVSPEESLKADLEKLSRG